jgi:hypothetical protein
LKLISSILFESHAVSVNKYTVDLSPAFLAMQIENNCDVVKALNENVRYTSLNNKQIDISLMIDVLEHIPNPEEALRELSRISRFTVFKQPLEDNLYLNAYNLVTGDKQKSKGIKTVGHINFYNFSNFKESIESCGGGIVEYYYTDVFGYHKKSGYYNGKNPLKKFVNELGSITYKISPSLSSKLLNNFLVALVRWRRPHNLYLRLQLKRGYYPRLRLRRLRPDICLIR